MLAMISTLLLAGSAAPAETPAEAKAADPDRMICERYEETGSRLGSTKVCRTAREWEAQRAKQKSQRKSETQTGN